MHGMQSTCKAQLDLPYRPKLMTTLDNAGAMRCLLSHNTEQRSCATTAQSRTRMASMAQLEIIFIATATDDYIVLQTADDGTPLVATSVPQQKFVTINSSTMCITAGNDSQIVQGVSFLQYSCHHALII